MGCFDYIFMARETSRPCLECCYKLDAHFSLGIQGQELDIC